MAPYLIQPQAVQLQYSLTQDPTHPGLRTVRRGRLFTTSFLPRDSLHHNPSRYRRRRRRLLHHCLRRRRRRSHRHRHRHHRHRPSRRCRRYCRVRSPSRREGSWSRRRDDLDVSTLAYVPPLEGGSAARVLAQRTTELCALSREDVRPR